MTRGKPHDIHEAGGARACPCAFGFRGVGRRGRGTRSSVLPTTWQPDPGQGGPDRGHHSMRSWSRVYCSPIEARSSCQARSQALIHGTYLDSSASGRFFGSVRCSRFQINLNSRSLANSPASSTCSYQRARASRISEPGGRHLEGTLSQDPQ